VWLLHFFQRILVLILVGYAWIFFRATTLESAWQIATKVFTGWTDAPSVLKLAQSILKNYTLLITFFAVFIMEIIHYFQERGSLRTMLAQKPAVLRWALYVGILVCILVFGRIYAAPTDFIYFQF
jgi:hypothetical protein